MSGAWFKNEDKIELGMNVKEACELCSEKEEDITHTLWDCKKIHTGDSCKQLKDLSRTDIPRNLKLGGPNAMRKQIDTNFFGKKEHEVSTSNEEMLEIIGSKTRSEQKHGRIQINEIADKAYKSILPILMPDKRSSN